MSSGVKCEDSCIEEYKKLQKDRLYKYIIFKISDDQKRIEVEELGPKEATYEEFVEKLKGQGADRCRYAVFDVDFEIRAQHKRNKIVFFQWCPDTCDIKSKMLYTSSVRAIRDKLKGLHKELQANDDGDLSYGHVLEKCQDKCN